MNLMINLLINPTIINLLKDKTVFDINKSLMYGQNRARD